jgi:hypothetical protein
VTLEHGYRYLGYALLILPAVLLVGFWVPYFSEFPHFEPGITPAVHLHALLQFSWVALAVLQPFAIGAGAFRLHRTLGKLSYVLVPLILLFGAAMLGKEYGEHRSDGMSSTAAIAAEYLSGAQLLLLTTFYALAIAHVRRADIAAHMRYMICIAIVLLPAGVGRVLGYLGGVHLHTSMAVCLALDCALMGALWLRDPPGVRRPYAVGLGLSLLVAAGWLALGRPV